MAWTIDLMRISLPAVDREGPDIARGSPSLGFCIISLSGLGHSVVYLERRQLPICRSAHTVGISRCNQFENRIYNFSSEHAVDPTMNASYVEELRQNCGRGGGDRRFAFLDAESAGTFDNGYYKSLQQHKGLLSSDQVLYTDPRSRPTVDRWAEDGNAFDQAFVTAMTKMGRVGMKIGSEGNIRVDCTKFNQ